MPRLSGVISIDDGRSLTKWDAYPIEQELGGANQRGQGRRANGRRRARAQSPTRPGGGGRYRDQQALLHSATR
jgi:hypothetical protein